MIWRVSLKNLRDSLKAQTGVDILDKIPPEQFKKIIGPDPEGIFNSYLSNMLSKNQSNASAKATHKFNPQTGKVEQIQ